MTIIIDYLEGVKLEKLQRLEEKFAFKLPIDYKTFLVNYNGGYPEPDCFKINDINDESTVDRFLSIDGGEFSNFETYMDTYHNRIPKNYIPIAHDPGGNLLLICIFGKKYGEIYFWDHEYEVDEGKIDTSNIYFIANNFDEFLEGLYVLDLT